jgi:hypothetical protein
LNPKRQGDVKKRRAKHNPSSFNIYQKVTIGIGMLALFGVVGIGRTYVPILSAGIIGATLIILLLLRKLKAKAEDLIKAEVKDVLPGSEEKAWEHEEGLPKDEDYGIAGVKEISSEAKLQEEMGIESPKKYPPGQERGVEVREIFPKRKDRLAGLQHSEAMERATDVEKMLEQLEERAVRIEETIAKFEEKVAKIQEMLLKSEEKVDLQMMLSDYNGDGENSGRLH